MAGSVIPRFEGDGFDCQPPEAYAAMPILKDSGVQATDLSVTKFGGDKVALVYRDLNAAQEQGSILIGQLSISGVVWSSAPPVVFSGNSKAVGPKVCF